jgi:hypothetical protein
MRKIDTIVIHCSDSKWGNAKLIESWHKERGWRTIGYHKVILNGWITYGRKEMERDGEIEEGRPEIWEGAHCYGYNKTSLGVCLIGKANDPNFPTDEQFFSLISLCKKWIKEYNIEIENVIGHREAQERLNWKNLKVCPGFDVNLVRDMLRKGPEAQIVKEERERFRTIKRLAMEIIAKC